jgi:3-oxoacyl-[acyl-carrier-protein] synthase II
MKAVPVVGAGVISAAGLGRQALGDALLLAGAAGPSPPPARAQVPAAALDADPTPPRARGRTSRAAVLAAIAARGALADAGWGDRREETGFFLGVGASGGSLDEIEAILAVSRGDDGQLSLARLGEVGLSASNPTFTFSSLHNFTLCHAAILEGLGGPNAAFFSRGAGTLTALEEAAQALTDGDCVRTLAGGADTALHPVTLAELAREGLTAAGLVPGEGAALLALGAGARPLACLELDDPPPPSHALLVGWGDPARRRLLALARERYPEAAVLDLGARVGECLAAQPALAWVAAVELVARRSAARVVVLSEGPDRQLATVTFGALA